MVSIIALVILQSAASGLEFGALISAVAFLGGTVIALAKVAWTERLTRLNNAEKERDYYRDEAITTMKQVAENQVSMANGLSVLTDVVEKAIDQGEMQPGYSGKRGVA